MSSSSYGNSTRDASGMYADCRSGTDSDKQEMKSKATCSYEQNTDDEQNGDDEEAAQDANVVEKEPYTEDEWDLEDEPSGQNTDSLSASVLDAPVNGYRNCYRENTYLPS